MNNLTNGLTCSQFDALLNKNILIFQNVLGGSFVSTLNPSKTISDYIADLNTNEDSIDALCSITTAQIPLVGSGLQIRNAINARMNSQKISANYLAALSTYLPKMGKFTAYERNPILSKSGTETMATFSSVLKVGSVYYIYYYNGISISRATSSDGKAWTKDVGGAVLDVGAVAQWDHENVCVPNVWKEGATWYMTYSGRSSGAAVYSIGLATSSDGITWTKSASNPIITPNALNWEAEGLEIWGIIKVDLTYYAFIDLPTSANRKVGIAISTDLINWTKDANNPIFTGGRFCVCPIKLDIYYFLIVPHYTSGTDYTEFEVYRDTAPTFYSANRTFTGILRVKSESGWDGVDADTPFILTDNINRNSFVDTNNELWMYFGGYNTEWKEGLSISLEQLAEI